MRDWRIAGENHETGILGVPHGMPVAKHRQAKHLIIQDEWNALEELSRPGVHAIGF